jgi:hypothetical protein
MIEDDNNDNTEQEDDEIDEEFLTPENILLYSTIPGPRIFTLTGSHEAILGLLLEESDDSFLVGMPARMILPLDDKGQANPDGVKTIIPYVPLPYFRLMKTAIMNVMYMFGEFEDLYMLYVEAKGNELYPELGEYYDPDQTVEIPDVDKTEIKPAEETVGLTQEAEDGNQVQGMSDEQLKEYLTDKYKNGELPGGSRKKQ